MKIEVRIKHNDLNFLFKNKKKWDLYNLDKKYIILAF